MKWPFRNKRQRGIAIIIGLFSLAAITMLVGAAVTAMPGQLFASAHTADTQGALNAASAGVEYAQARIQSGRGWNGRLGYGPQLTVDTPTMQVMEDNGNVIGIIVQPDGSKTAFRMKFNYQNGNSAPDEGCASDPTSTHIIKNGDICINNLAQSIDEPIPVINSATGVAVNTTPAGQLPKFNVQLQVEGLSGPSLSTATVDNIQTLLDTANVARQIYHQHVSARLTISGLSRVDTAVASASDFLADLATTTGETKVEQAPGTTSPKLRALTRAERTATGGSFSTVGQVITGAPAISPNVDLLSTSDPNYQYGVSVTDSASHFLSVKSSQVQKATTANTRLMAGTYVWRQNGGNYQLEYYRQNFDGTTIPTGPPDDVMSNPGDYGRFRTNGTGVDFDFTSMQMNVTDRVYVEPQSSGTVKDFAVVIEPTLQSTLNIRPQAVFNAPSGSDAILSSDGSVTMQGSMDGYGGVTAAQNITFQGASTFETDPLNAICVYAGQDINIDAIPDSVRSAIAAGGQAVATNVGMGMGRKVGWKAMQGMSMGTVSGSLTTTFAPDPGDVSLLGVVYALGDIHINLGDKGNFYSEGVVTAFGGNPDANETAGTTAGKGKIHVNALNAEFYFDPSYLTVLSGDPSPTNPISLERVAWNLMPDR